ncbi:MULTISPECIES: AAA family ATPase [Streptomyces]|uniref:AAA family ATPase n=1 Tax=Streptomyces TaxID=1883 RepID=UPI0036D006CB
MHENTNPPPGRDGGNENGNNEPESTVTEESVWANIPGAAHEGAWLELQAEKEERDRFRVLRDAQMYADLLDAKERGKRLHESNQRARLESEEGREQLASAFAVDTYDSARLDELPEPVALVDGLLFRQTLFQIFGPPKSYKSFVMLYIAFCVGAGNDCFGRKTERTKVLYVVAEGAYGIRKRVRALEQHYGRKMTGVVIYPKPVQITDPDQARALVAYMLREGIGLVVYDTQARCTVGVDENSAQDFGRVVDALGAVQGLTGAACGTVHHSGLDGGRGRGSTSQDGAVDTALETRRDGARVSLVTKYQKDAENAQDIELEMVNVGESLVVELAECGPVAGAEPAPPPLSEKQLAYLRVLGDFGDLGATGGTVAGELCVNRSAAERALVRLEGLACAERVTSTSRFKITNLGARAVYEAVREQPEQGGDQGGAATPDATLL